MPNLEKTQTPETAVVYVVNGTGNQAVPIPYASGDTVSSILKKADIKINFWDAVTLGRKQVKFPDTTEIKPNDTLVITTKISNGNLRIS